MRLSGPTLFAPIINQAAHVRGLRGVGCQGHMHAPRHPCSRNRPNHLLALPCLQIAAEPSQHLQYYVLLILTDGCGAGMLGSFACSSAGRCLAEACVTLPLLRRPCRCIMDMRNTLQALVDASQLPLSLLVRGQEVV